MTPTTTYTQLTTLEELVGRRIERASNTQAGIVLIFDDGSFASIVGAEFDGNAWCEVNACQLCTPDAYAAGLISEEVYRVWRNEEAARHARETEAYELREYERLRAKFEGA